MEGGCSVVFREGVGSVVWGKNMWHSLIVPVVQNTRTVRMPVASTFRKFSRDRSKIPSFDDNANPDPRDLLSYYGFHTLAWAKKNGTIAVEAEKEGDGMAFLRNKKPNV